ncbi:MAG: DUF3810 domain-containing protein [Clostridia bacterium]|nr:DUF3810 domain-containing protein [Clostridia bacterium]
MNKSKLWVKWILALIPALIAALMYFILPHFPEFTENIITLGIFKIFSLPFQWLVSILPFSLTEAVVLLGIPILIILLVIWIIRIVKSQKPSKNLERGFRFIAFCLSLLLLIFMVMDGANFSRKPIGQLLDLPDGKYTADDLYKVTCDLALNASKAREVLPEDENGCVTLSVSQNKLLLLADDCFDSLKEEYPFMTTGVWRVKSVALSHLWSYTGYTGVYCPWLSEASINTDVPASELGHTAAHEIAHTVGFARENECNFIGFLACSGSSQADYKYSGYLAAFIYCSNALYKADKELWRDAYGNLSDGVLRDIKQRGEYWDSFSGEVMESSQAVNDTFIKANGDKNGVLSYNLMVELMLRYYDKNGLI